VDRNVSASTQNQALSVILFLYRHVLKRELAWMDDIVRAKRPSRMPTVLSAREVATLLKHLRGAKWLMANLIYGAGLRLRECARLRVKDVDFQRREILVREGKGGKDRVTMLPDRLMEPLREQRRRVRRLHESDLQAGFKGVSLPFALARKYPNAPSEFAWQCLFPSRSYAKDPRTGNLLGHHAYPDTLQRAMKKAARLAGIDKPVSTHTLRHAST
jgi:integron integrase